MKQTRLISLIEAVLNTVIGFFVSFVGWPIAALITGISYSTGQHVAVVAFFTVLSITRGYVIRRFFNDGLHLRAVRLAFWIKPHRYVFEKPLKKLSYEKINDIRRQQKGRIEELEAENANLKADFNEIEKAITDWDGHDFYPAYRKLAFSISALLQRQGAGE